MRELTLEECFLVAGGNWGDDPSEVSEITVIAPPIPPYVPPPWAPPSPPPSPPPPSSGGSGGGGTGSGGGSPPADRPQNFDECQDRETDQVANAAKANLDNYQYIDYAEGGYLLWKDANGTIRMSSPLYGNSNYLTDLNPGSQPGDFGIPSWASVVGIVHSHPEYKFTLNSDGTINVIQVTLQDGHHLPSSGDWQWPDFMVSQGADAANFRQYIYFAGQIYEYNYYNNQTGARQTAAVNAGGTCP